MPDPLAAYRAEIRAQEDEWVREQFEEVKGLIAFDSPWESNFKLLSEIDKRHGVSPDDPRVYSIAAYQAEVRQIEEEWNDLLTAKGWEAVGADNPSFREARAAGSRASRRRIDCFARHFPGINSASRVDSVPKAWAYAGQCIQIAEQVARAVASHAEESKIWNEHVQEVYSILHKLKHRLAPRPPYRKFPPQQARAEIIWIQNKLEREDCKRCKALILEQPSQEKRRVSRKGRKELKTTRHRKPRTVELLLVFLEDRRNANLNCTELARQLGVHVSSVSRAFKHKKYGSEILRRYYGHGIKPPRIREI